MFMYVVKIWVCVEHERDFEKVALTSPAGNLRNEDNLPSESGTVPIKLFESS